MRLAHRIYKELIEQLRGAAVAFLFLSRIPMPYTPPFNSESCRRSALFFPLVGLVIGAILYSFAWLATFWFPPVVVAVMLTWLWIVLTGALHLDGFIDTADGLFSHRSPSRMLEIMSDSRIGAMGATAAVLALMAKAALIYAMLEADLASFLFYWLFVPAFSRWFMVFAIAGWPYARKADGLGLLFSGIRWPHAVGSYVLLLLLAALMQMTPLKLSLSQWTIGTGLLTLVTIAGGTLMARHLSGKLGGLTGDCYGALNESLEILLLLTAWLGVMRLTF